MIYLASGKAPFIQGSINLMDQIPQIKKRKNKEKPSKFCGDPKCVHLVPFAEKIYSLKFDEEPEYSKLRFMLEKCLLERN